MANLAHHPYLHEVKTSLQADAIATKSEKPLFENATEVEHDDVVDAYEKRDKKQAQRKLITNPQDKPKKKGLDAVRALTNSNT